MANAPKIAVAKARHSERSEEPLYSARKASMPRLLPTMLCTLALSAHAASFDCRLAKSPREKAICADPKLSAADSALAAQYAALRAKLTPAAFAAVQQDQRDWLKYLDVKCIAPDMDGKVDISGCLLQQYGADPRAIEGRSHELRTLHAGPALLYTRAQYFTVPDTGSPADRSSTDPGFGDYVYRWPQADAATGPLAGWNAAVYALVLKLGDSSSTGEHHPASLRDGADGEEAVEVNYALEGVNDHYLLTSFTNFTYGYGAAHPSTSVSELNYSLDLGRELQPDDVFATSTAWQDKLTAMTIRKLKAARVDIWDGEEGVNGVRSGVTSAQQWTLDSNGLTVNFGQYQINCCACGGGDVTFTWTALKPLLNPAFHPEDLPPPHPPRK